jgi:G:T/U-mismatch repair DNA glycosylase
MQAVTGNAITVVINGQEVRTLRDILPETPGLRVLFVAKTPAPGSVELGHYFQGVQGRLFWKLMKQYGLLRPTTDFEDDSLLDHGYGLTDIAKLPRPFDQEPSQANIEPEHVGLSNSFVHIVRRWSCSSTRRCFTT